MSDLLQLDGIVKRFVSAPTLVERLAARLTGTRAKPQVVHAVEDVSLSIPRGETLGLVGESGCGKSTLARIAAGIHAADNGIVTLDGALVRIAGEKQTTRVQMVFQDPFASLDPRMRIQDLIAEGPLAHGLMTRANADVEVARLLATVGLDASFASRFPHQFSGGQRQRVAIARALAMQPDVLICDEPVASLDVSIQAQILNLFLQLRRELRLTMLFISHDLGVIRHISDRVAIMYLGRIVELGPTEDVLSAPRHPYTRALVDSVPRLNIGPDEAALRPIAGELPSPLNPPSGCAFHTRCPRMAELGLEPLCTSERPVISDMDGRALACHAPL
ncbi:AppF ABC-type oligopeptide transport system, ATPase component [Rhabdaerophilaceae bacterium]